MGKFRYASLKYCTHLGKNVVMQSYYESDGNKVIECLNKFDCGFCEHGCRNALFKPIVVSSAIVSLPQETAQG